MHRPSRRIRIGFEGALDETNRPDHVVDEMSVVPQESEAHIEGVLVAQVHDGCCLVKPALDFVFEPGVGSGRDGVIFCGGERVAATDFDRHRVLSKLTCGLQNALDFRRREI